MIVFTEPIEIKAISGNAHLVKTVEIKGGFHVISEELYSENQEAIDSLGLSFETREIKSTEWIKTEL